MSLVLNHILCIDDESDILNITKFTLENIGHYTVTACSNGPEGLAAAGDVQPDIILLDVMMPGMDGAATLKMLQQNARTQNIPVIFMTARVRPVEIDNYKAMGVIGVVAKPFDPLTLSATVQSYWQEVTEKNNP